MSEPITDPEEGGTYEAYKRLEAKYTAAIEAIKATEALDFRDDCEQCRGEEMPELCGLCFPMADDARLKRRAVLEAAKL